MSKWATFVHPHKAYRLEYPAEWENLQQDDARSCGFGPKERDNVGLWISILPASVDTDRLVEDLPKMMDQVMNKADATNIRRDTTLHHYGLKADMTKEDQGGHYWIVAGGDLVLFASTQVPVGEKETWNPLFDRLMASVQITRDDALFMRKVANEVLLKLREAEPDQDFEFDEQGIKGKNRVVYLSNVYREVRQSPHRRKEIIENFIEGLQQSAHMEMGYEEWDQVNGQILPVLKPHDYIRDEGPTRHLCFQEWLADVIICYAIKTQKLFRFLTGWDLNRWGITLEACHQKALENLAALEWPKRLEGSRQRDGGRVVLICTEDSFSSSRLLHPDFHRLFSGPLGSPFYAGIPDRNTLVAFSNRKSLKQRIFRQLKKDFHGSGYPITPQPFLVTADGIAVG